MNKKHTLACLGLLFAFSHVFAQDKHADLKNHALNRMETFVKLLDYYAGPSLDMETKGRIERHLVEGFLENDEVRFYQDLNHQFGAAQVITASQYFNQLKVLYPNGAQLKSSKFQMSDLFHNKARNIHYFLFRCEREFLGYNVLAKKQISILKEVEYRVKVAEGGAIQFKILGCHLAEGPIHIPPGLDETSSQQDIDELNGNPEQDERLVQQADNLLKEARQKTATYESLTEAKRSSELAKKETKEERKARKAKEQLERARIKREMAKNKEERKSLQSNKYHIRFGVGTHLIDSSLMSMIYRENVEDPMKSWVASVDIQRKFAGLERLPDGKWSKAHTYGLFLNYGKNSSHSLSLLSSGAKPISIDELEHSKSFFEAEGGIMLREELRLSAGSGFMQYQVAENDLVGFKTRNKSYFLLTTGLAPRVLPFMDLEMNLSWLMIDSRLSPRVSVCLLFLIKAGRG